MAKVPRFYSHCHENCNEGRIGVELAVDVISYPLVVDGGIGIRSDLPTQLRLDSHQRKEEAQTTILQDLHHSILVQL